MIDEIGIDGILQISPSIVGEEDINCFAARVGLVVGRCDIMINGCDDIGVWREQLVGFDLFQGQRHRFLSKRTTDFLERIKVAGGAFLDEIDVRKAALDNSISL